MSPMAATTEPTTKTPGGVSRAAPGRGLPARAPTAPAVVNDGPARESGQRDDKILAALTDQLASLESSQRVRDKAERMLGALESGLFASKLGANMRGRPMTIDAIGDAEEKAPVPRGYQRATDLGASRFASLEPPRARSTAAAAARTSAFATSAGVCSATAAATSRSATSVCATGSQRLWDAVGKPAEVEHTQVRWYRAVPRTRERIL